MSIISVIHRLKISGKSLFRRKADKGSPERDTKTDIPVRRQYPGAELEDYYLYYLYDPLKDSMAVRARIIYITKNELLFAVDADTTLPGSQGNTSDKSPPSQLLFAAGKNISLKLQVPFRSEFVRATGRVLGIECDAVSHSINVKVAYTKILGNDNEVLFDTILDMLM
ncbi:MAG: hypothetical protein HRF42_04030 [Candidatus Brocadia sp.]|jgi:hypothetical protein